MESDRDQTTPDPAAPDEQISLRFAKFSAFVEEYSENVSLGGIFIKTTEPLAIGSTVALEFRLTDGFRLLHGAGEVAWYRAADGPENPAGMALRFLALDETGRELVLKILEEQIKSGGTTFEVGQIPPGAISELEPAAPTPAPSADDFHAPWGEQLPDLPEEILRADDSASLTPIDLSLVDQPASVVPSSAISHPQSPPAAPAAQLDLPSFSASPPASADLSSPDRLEPGDSSVEPSSPIFESSQPVVFDLAEEAAAEVAATPGLQPFELEEGPVPDFSIGDERSVADTASPAPASPANPADLFAFDIGTTELEDLEDSTLVGQRSEAPGEPVFPDHPQPPVEDLPRAPQPLSAFESRDLVAPASPSSLESGPTVSAGAPIGAAPAPSSPSFLQPEEPLPIPQAAQPALHAAGSESASEEEPADYSESSDYEEWDDEAITGQRRLVWTIDRLIARSKIPVLVVSLLFLIGLAAYRYRDRLGLGSSPSPSVGQASTEEPAVATADASTIAAKESSTLPTLDGNEAETGEVLAAFGDSDTDLGENVEQVDDSNQVSDEEPVIRAPSSLPEAAPGQAVPSSESASDFAGRSDSPSSAARNIDQIAWRQIDEGTLVTIRADGLLSEDRYRHNRIGGAAVREVIRLSGIEAPYTDNQVAVDSAQVRQIRTGFHPGNELHIVFDLATDRASLASTRLQGERLELLFRDR